MLLVFDIGNTNTVIGLYQKKNLIAHWRIATDRNKTADEYGILLKQMFQHYDVAFQNIDGAIISSVVPNLTGTFKKMIETYFDTKPMVVGQGIKSGIPIRYENPKEVGADRIVNAVAGVENYGVPLILLDFGTATTFCVVNEKGEYLGGVIAPGIGISSNALFEKTAQLPKVELVPPKHVIGRNTVNAIQSGLIYGYCSLVDGMVTRIIEELNTTRENIKVVATGGLAEMMYQHASCIDVVDQMLTLEGLRIIYERNKS